MRIYCFRRVDWNGYIEDKEYDVPDSLGRKMVDEGQAKRIGSAIEQPKKKRKRRTKAEIEAANKLNEK
jgi:hypothetical protein